MAESKQPVGAIMVIGAGIGGMQASIDLANSGIKVYLVERDTAIGGRMAMLDKTFPTNDCSMCIISPKLIEVGRHPNIEILTSSELLGVEGNPGNFKAKVLRHPRYVDIEKCTGCGECAKVCPVERPNEYNMDMSTRRAIRKRYPQAIPGAFAIEKAGTSPCRDACPAHTRCQGYVALVAEGRYEEAIDVIRRELPLPGSIGRVCPHPCEDACNRGDVDEPIAICDVKRFAADYEMLNEKEPNLPECAPDTGKKIAIVGGGPAGLSAAWFLRLKGHSPIIYEASPEAGGMLRTGIPSYRLPREVLAREIGIIEKLGVEIKTNTAIGKDVSVDSLQSEHDAIFLAMGAQKGRGLGIEGEDAKGVFSGVKFLYDTSFNESDPPKIGKKVVVIGGGDVAYDVARTSKRVQNVLGHSGTEVHLCCLESREEMLASEIEIIEGEEEGVKRHNSVGPVEIQKDENGNVKAIVLRKCLNVFDENGKFAPTFDDNDKTTIECDTVMIAIGQAPDSDMLKGTPLEPVLNHGWIKGDALTFETEVEGVFAGGDIFTGPNIAISAIAAGTEAAESIDRWFKGEDLKAGRGWNPDLAPKPDYEGVQHYNRAKKDHLPAAERVKNFDEVFKGLIEDAAKAEAARCLSCGICSECGLCEIACQASAVMHHDKPREEEVDVASVILAPGFDQFEAEKIGEYGYGRWPNVITSLEFERMLSATGPSNGHVMRPSDHGDPKKVAWIQCVASRDKRQERGYCSNVCCMFATKEAVIASDHAGGDFDATIFMMDLRATGKGFDEYCNRAQDKYGVKYVRSMISRVDEVPETKDIEVTYVDEEGKLQKETFDLLVLSTGLKPGSMVKELADRVGVELDEYGFAKTDPFKPVATSKPGIFVCGVMQGPKDIPETVAQASGAAAFAGEHSAAARGTAITNVQLPPERDTEKEDQKIGVWVCNCGINIGSVVNVDEVADYASNLGDVIHSEGVLFACSQDNQEHMKEVMKEKGINRMVVASCTPRTHEPLFQATLRDVGVNRYLFSMANIREHCSWVHSKEPEKATDKAKMLVDMAVRNARQLKPLHEKDQSLIHRGLVIGGGLAGMTAAMKIAEQGFGVTLIEKTDKLGGNILRVNKTHDGMDVVSYRKELMEKVESHENITVMKNARLVRTEGFLGNFESTIEVTNGAKERVKIEHGVTIVATGGHETKPTDFAYGQSEHIITQLELEDKIAKGLEGVKEAKEVVMIQCVGSRNDERSYCSKLCCSQALKNAIEIKEANPETNVTILYREMRSYGLKEKLFAKARSLGVLFIRYSQDNPPKVEPEGDKAKVTVDVPRMGAAEIDADWVVLASAIEPNENKDISEILKLPRTNENYFLEVHQKLGPVDFASDGIFMAGLAHAPKPIEESIAQAAAAASRALTILSQEMLRVGGQVSVVDPDLCAVCLNCVRACPYGVPIIKDGAAYIEPAECRGCGVCASECPGKAIQLQHFTNDQIESMLSVLTDYQGG